MLSLAVERYRQEKGAWLESLQALVLAGYVKAIPLDPYDGQPVRYRRLPDGVVLFSVGPDRIDNSGTLNPDNAQAPPAPTRAFSYGIPSAAPANTVTFTSQDSDAYQGPRHRRL